MSISGDVGTGYSILSPVGPDRHYTPPRSEKETPYCFNQEGPMSEWAHNKEKLWTPLLGV